MIRAAAVGIALVICVACAYPSASFVNPAECGQVVEQHRLDPTREVDTPPQPQGVRIPVVRTSEAVEVRMVVNESGSVDRRSISVTGTDDRNAITAIVDAVAEWPYEPARVGGCWVPASTGVEISTSR